jgi:hypothetical protein
VFKAHVRPTSEDALASAAFIEEAKSLARALRSVTSAYQRRRLAAHRRRSRS